ncbi:MAG TPA: FliI/YscN family ATPase [Vulgatibacter sp.]|nr:FliI/YscN family ATPase [Vulgatibacter sp.]
MSLIDPARLKEALSRADPVGVRGRVVRAAGLVVEALLPKVAVGTTCEIETSADHVVQAEIIGFTGSTALLMPFGDMAGVYDGCPVVPRPDASDLQVGDALIGRVVDTRMRPLDGGPVPLLRNRVRLDAPPPPAMARRRIEEPLVTGIRAVDSLLTIGEGQRVGIMAGPGVGKSVLLAMLARQAKVDVVVAGMVGERGREVREFVERDLGSEGMARSVIVLATSNEPPIVRVKAAMAATAVAEYFRSKGKRVLLLIDSLSRVAMAQREIGLAAGEPPTTKGYPPSVFAILPRLLERAGTDAGEGSITGVYTVLAEGDDHADPVVDAARSILDGHLMLSRKLAAAGHFPAIDVLTSVSRVMPDVTGPEHRALAQAARDQLASYQESADLIEIGAYAHGSNPRLDRALRHRDSLLSFLRQSHGEARPLPDVLQALRTAVGSGPEENHRG